MNGELLLHKPCPGIAPEAVPALLAVSPAGEQLLPWEPSSCRGTVGVQAARRAAAQCGQWVLLYPVPGITTAGQALGWVGTTSCQQWLPPFVLEWES